MKNKAFTLIELLIAVSIIALMVITGFFLAKNQYLKGVDAKRKSDIHKIQEALEEYEKDHDCYPLPQLMTCTPGTGLIPYISKLPCDISTNVSYFYDYQNSNCPKWYRIFISLENLSDKDLLAGIGPYEAFNFYLGSPNAPVPVSQVASPTPSPSSTPSPEPDSFYGCLSGICTPISWDPARPGPECDPNYQNVDCYSQCVFPANECVDWNS